VAFSLVFPDLAAATEVKRTEMIASDQTNNRDVKSIPLCHLKRLAGIAYIWGLCFTSPYLSRWK
jgi:hypothetical protein